jgi:hypothetical protein
MANNIIPVQQYRINSSDIFFFDNNIWMYILCPLGNYNFKRQKAYSQFLSYILSHKLHIFTNSLVLSEFSNRYLKLDFDIHRSKPENVGSFKNFKKDYMGSSQCIATITEIKQHLKNILSMCQRCSDEFNSLNLDTVFNLFTSIGFNDSYYINQAVAKKWIIVTDDSDLVKPNIPDKNLTILTYR